MVISKDKVLLQSQKCPPRDTFVLSIDIGNTFAAGFARVLKIFAVCYGLLVASASILTQGRRAPATRKSLQTFAKDFLMHAHKSLRKTVTGIHR